MGLKIFVVLLLIIFEIPLFLKARIAYKNIDIIRFVAILILMFLTALFIYGIYLLILFVIR